MRGPGIVGAPSRSGYALDFAGGDRLAAVQRAGFAYARSGTAWDELAASYAANVPAISAARGYFSEAAYTNLNFKSLLDSAQWSSVTAAGEIINASGTGPDGAASVAKLREKDTTSASRGALGQNNIAWTSGNSYMVTARVKPVERTWVRLGAASLTNPYAWFNLSGAGALGTRQANATASGIAALANGWYLCWSIFTSSGTQSSKVQVNITTADNVTSYVGVVASGVLVENVAVYFGPAYPTSPVISTLLSAATRNAPTCIAKRPPLGARSWAWNARTAYGAPAASTYQVLAQLDDGTSSNRVSVRRNSSRAVELEVTDGGSSTLNVTGGTVADDTVFNGGLSLDGSGNFRLRVAGTDYTGSHALPAALTGGLTTERLGHGVAQWWWDHAVGYFRAYDQALDAAGLAAAADAL